jgi:putative ABC transport system permease protein
MLFGDRAKFLLLVFALTFSSLLIAQQSSIFFGLLRWTTSMLRNTKAKIWVVAPKVESVSETQGMRDIELQRVRSVAGVAWAMPLSSTNIQARLANGSFQNLQLIGIDDTTFAGAPKQIIDGDFNRLAETRAVVVDVMGAKRFGESLGRPLQVGDSFAINDHEVQIVAICKIEENFSADTVVFTTYSRAAEIRPKERRILSHIIVEPKPGVDPKDVVRQIEQDTGLRAFTEEQLSQSTVDWFFRRSGIPIAVANTVLMGFIVGIAIAAQTFYSFILENLPHLGAMKAMGISNAVLIRMLFVQAFTVGFIGYGLGVGMAAIYGFIIIPLGNPPFYIPSEVLIALALAILAICIFSVCLGVRKINSLSPAQVFRV